MDMASLEAELKWLKENPEFDERPATIEDFVGPNYLNIESRMRPAIMDELREIFGDVVSSRRIAKYQRAMVTGGIGIGKTTIASVVLPYLAHWVLCLRDPQGFFDLLPGSRIAFMQMSTSGDQAKEVVFGDIKARIEYSPWFANKYPFDSRFKNQIRFEKDIWILPGDSAETTFEGYNILGGILDEADSHKVTKNKDYAEQGYTTIYSRITSRFQDRGFILVIGQMKKASGFAAKKYNEFRKDAGAYAVRMAIWESFGWHKYMKPDGTRDSFWYDTERKEIIPSGAAKMLQSEKMIEVPNMYKQDFINNPEKALRDLAGIPPAVGSPFISLTYKITECRDRWIAKNSPLRGPITKTSNYLPIFEPWFVAPDRLKRVCHLDLAFSDEGDALGFAMGHVSEMIEDEDGERKPFIWFDLLARIHAPAGSEIFLSDVRRMIYELRDERKFKIDMVTMDGFQSTDTRQQLERKRISSEIISVDRQKLPYEDLREAIYEGRLAFPEYMIRLRPDDVELTEIAVTELMELSDEGNKIDHPEGGSKDVADAMAGVVYTLMGDRSYHKNAVRHLSESAQRPQAEGYRVPRPSQMGPGDIHAPLPPNAPTAPSHAWRPPPRRV